MSTCPNCKIQLTDNQDPKNVVKVLKDNKKKGLEKKCPLLVADFYCKNCNNVIHVKWIDLDRELNLLSCAKCDHPLYASVFLGVMNGFSLQSYCFNCQMKLGKGNVGSQK